MAKRMRLIPDSLYKQIFNSLKVPSSLLVDRHLLNEPSLVKDKSSILNAMDIPDEVKQSLYHEVSRNLNEKLQKDSKRPILVKNEDAPEPTTPSSTTTTTTTNEQSAPKIEAEDSQPSNSKTQLDYILKMVGSARTLKILNNLKDAGIYYNKSNNVIINGNVYSQTNIIDILRCLTNAKYDAKDIQGIQEVVYHIKKSHVPLTSFTAGVRKNLFEINPSTPKTSSHNSPRILWETY